MIITKTLRAIYCFILIFTAFLLSDLSALAASYTFTDQEDDKSGLYYYDARYYDPDLSRFISADSVDTFAISNDPQSLNRYSYVRNNPVNRIDPSGSIDITFYAEGANISNNYYSIHQSFTINNLSLNRNISAFGTGIGNSPYGFSDEQTMAFAEGVVSLVDPIDVAMSGYRLGNSMYYALEEKWTYGHVENSTIKSMKMNGLKLGMAAVPIVGSSLVKSGKISKEFVDEVVVETGKKYTGDLSIRFPHAPNVMCLDSAKCTVSQLEKGTIVGLKSARGEHFFAVTADAKYPGDLLAIDNSAFGLKLKHPGDPIIDGYANQLILNVAKGKPITFSANFKKTFTEYLKDVENYDPALLENISIFR
jgi:RHS repeat-associated protein